MAIYEVNLSAAAEARLALLVTRYNKINNSAVTLGEWITQHIKELAVQRELAESAEGIREQVEKDTETALNAERQRLLAVIDAVP